MNIPFLNNKILLDIHQASNKFIPLKNSREIYFIKNKQKK
jgi:hypothetical protein